MSGRFHLARFLNVLWIYALCLVLLGAYTYQYSEHQMPCPLCELQRLAMIAVSIGPMLNLWFGIQPIHYGLSIVGCILGGAISLRQICLHICPGFPTFGYRVWGFELYTWAFFVFAASILGIALLLFLYLPKDSNTRHKLCMHEKFAFILMFLIAMANVITTIIQCGLGPCSD